MDINNISFKFDALNLLKEKGIFTSEETEFLISRLTEYYRLNGTEDANEEESPEPSPQKNEEPQIFDLSKNEGVIFGKKFKFTNRGFELNEYFLIISCFLENQFDDIIEDVKADLTINGFTFNNTHFGPLERVSPGTKIATKAIIDVNDLKKCDITSLKQIHEIELRNFNYCLGDQNRHFDGIIRLRN